MSKKQESISITEASLCWSWKMKSVGVLRYPIDRKEFQSGGYTSDTGASFAQWDEATIAEQISILLARGMRLIKEDGYSPDAVWEALATVKEINDLFENNELA